jgi:hypothetical protein
MRNKATADHTAQEYIPMYMKWIIQTTIEDIIISFDCLSSFLDIQKQIINIAIIPRDCHMGFC